MKKQIVPPNNEELETLCSTLKIIANPNRLRILMLLLNGENSVSEIEGILSIKQPSLSQELRNLRDSGLVSTRRESKVIFYSITGLPEKHTVRKLCSALLSDNNGPDAIEPYYRGVHRRLVEKNRHGECGHFPSVLIT